MSFSFYLFIVTWHNGCNDDGGGDMAAIVFQTNKKSGIKYAYESVSTWDKVKKCSTAKRKLIGRVDPDTGEIVPTRKLAKITGAPAENSQKSKKTLISKRDFFGATYLLDEIGEKIGLTKDLKKCFPDSYQQILSLAYYLILEEGSPMFRFPKWASIHSHPFGKEISSQRSSELFQMITEDDKQNFFRLQGKRRQEKEYLAFDTSSVSSFSKSLKKVRYGKNKEHVPLPQINLTLLFGEQSMLPVCYRLLPGNISDVKTIEKLIKDMDFLDIQKLNLVMDRGFYSESNINELYKHHHKFLIGAKLSLNFIKAHLDVSRGIMVTRSHYSSKYNIYYDSVTTGWNYTETKSRSGEIIKEKRRLYIHFYYNDAKAAEEREVFNRMLDMLEDELITNKHRVDHEKAYKKYFIVNETPIRGVTVEAKQDMIDDAEKNYGYFALISNGIQDPLYALENYRSKDAVEKAFGNLKERLNMRRHYVSSEESLEGKVFVQFIALIFLSYIKKCMSDNDLFKKFTFQSMLDEIDIIEKYDVPAHRSHVSEVTEKQKKIYQFMGVAFPT